MKGFWVSIIVLMMSISVFAESDKEVSAAVKKVFEDNLKYCCTEDTKGILSTFHTKSAAYPSLKKLSQQIAKFYDLKYEMESFKFVGLAGEYAVARVVQKTTKIKGPAFRNNIIDTLQVFKKENGKWKIWTTTILSRKFL